MIVYGVLIEHATAGLLLFETGCHDEMEEHWGPVSHRTSLVDFLGLMSDCKDKH